ncbi:sugar transferase [Brevundimonas sp. PWP3-1b1]|uniref:sugar transferase n=1 Tax=unclassified Brevundimonas TaxID=2622653 RepID=UPI003CFB4AA4
MAMAEAAGRRQARVRANTSRRGGDQARLIRALDIVVSLAAILFFLPLMVVTALAIRGQDGGPALFRQARLGRGGVLFDCLKFRSMAVDAEARLPDLVDEEWAATRKFRRDARVTRLGRVLRLSSLDELPQLINVLRGEMCLVGPRPIVLDEAKLYGRRLQAYCAVRPGLTGLWQISGRNDVAYCRRVAMDVWLVRNASVRVYLMILARTIPAVLSRRGAC